jgi:hypothetical protein
MVRKAKARRKRIVVDSASGVKCVDTGLDESTYGVACVDLGFRNLCDGGSAQQGR